MFVLCSKHSFLSVVFAFNARKNFLFVSNKVESSIHMFIFFIRILGYFFFITTIKK